MLAYPIRLAIFGIFVAITYTVVYDTHMAVGSSIGRENGPIEVAQVVFACLATLGFAVATARTRIGKAGLIVCGGMLAYAAARESDMLFEEMMFDDAYKYVVGVPVLLIIGAAAFVQRSKVVAETLHLLNQPAATIFILAGIFLAFVCQTLDRPAMWLESDHITKMMIEETVELFAYLMFTFSATEAIWFANSTIIGAAPSSASKSEQPALRIAA